MAKRVTRLGGLLAAYQRRDPAARSKLEGFFLYPGIWAAGGGRCEIHHDHRHFDHVVHAGGPVYLSGESLPNGAYGGVVRDVCGLGSAQRNFRPEVPERPLDP